MLVLIYALTCISAALAREFFIADRNMPIQEVHSTFGVFDHERVTYVRAVIRPYHLNTTPAPAFPTSGWLKDYYSESIAQGDERGYILSPFLSGTNEWFNVSPQNPRVNRNTETQSLNADWYGTECEVKRYLKQKGERYVVWEVYMTYLYNSNRPDSYSLQVGFYNAGYLEYRFDTLITNPFLKNDRTFYTCDACSDSKEENEAIKSGDRCTKV